MEEGLSGVDRSVLRGKSTSLEAVNSGTNGHVVKEGEEGLCS